MSDNVYLGKHFSNKTFFDRVARVKCDPYWQPFSHYRERCQRETDLLNYLLDLSLGDLEEWESLLEKQVSLPRFMSS